MNLISDVGEALAFGYCCKEAGFSWEETQEKYEEKKRTQEKVTR